MTSGVATQLSAFFFLVHSVSGPSRRSHLDIVKGTTAEGKDGQGKGRRGAEFGALIVDNLRGDRVC
jgi:hypothetical protein